MVKSFWLWDGRVEGFGNDLELVGCPLMGGEH